MKKEKKKKRKKDVYTISFPLSHGIGGPIKKIIKKKEKVAKVPNCYKVGAPKKIIPRVHPHQHPYSPNKRNHKPNKYLYLKRKALSKVAQKGRINKVFSPLLYAVKFCVYMCVVGFNILATPNP
jgi:hypothetical protein